MTKYDRLREVFTERELKILDYFYENAVIDNEIELPKAYKDWYSGENKYICQKKQTEIAEDLHITTTSVSRSISMFSTYGIVRRFNGIKGYLVNKDWLMQEYKPYN